MGELLWAIQGWWLLEGEWGPRFCAALGSAGAPVLQERAGVALQGKKADAG